LLEQAIVNLIENAIRYSDENKRVIISLEKINKEALISIQDNGIGIPKDSLPRIFERFYSANKARSRSLGGSGLGLSIVKHIIEAHEGRVTVESEEGQGSTFSVYLPLS
jgi:two-component system phosphate regulon sensor histidine kinase PhoR